MSQNTQIAAAIKLACDCIIDAAEAAKDTGAPVGVIYAALNGHGMSLNTFTSLVSALEKAGKIRKSGNLIFPG